MVDPHSSPVSPGSVTPRLGALNSFAASTSSLVLPQPAANHVQESLSTSQNRPRSRSLSRIRSSSPAPHLAPLHIPPRSASPSGRSGRSFTEPSPLSPRAVDIDHEPELSEAELRRLYENEEIDRFLRVFAREVREVRVRPDKHKHPKPPEVIVSPCNEPDAIPLVLSDDEIAGEPMVISVGEPTEEDSDDEGSIQETERSWMRVSDSATSLPSAIIGRSTAVPTSLSAVVENVRTTHWPSLVANNYVLPHLPAHNSQVEAFTLARMRLTIQRLYLVCYPIYVPFAERLWRLATWSNLRQSTFWCIAYWILWWHNLILAAAVARVIYAIMRRKILKYPSKSDLIRRRQDAERAEAMGDALQKRLQADGNLGLRDAWRVFRIVVRGKKKKAKQKAADALPEPTQRVSEEVDREERELTAREEEDIRRSLLQLADEWADLHERVTNIFRWRRPVATTRYTLALLVILLMVIFVPTHYIAKFVFFKLGVLFWFVVPVIMAIPKHERGRIPPPFADVPTDAEYAMELISGRVARGERVVPTRAEKKKKKPKSKSVENVSATIPNAPSSPSINSSVLPGGVDEDEEDEPTPHMHPIEKKLKDVDWKRIKDKAVKGIQWAEEGKKIFSSSKRERETSDSSPSSPEDSRTSLQLEDGKSFPAQHIASPGLLTLTPTMLLFTPLLSSHAKIQIPLADIRGVKKTTRLNGLIIRHVDRGATTASSQQSPDAAGGTNLGSPLSATVEKEEKFRWIHGRDEVFAKLVGWGGRRWVKI